MRIEGGAVLGAKDAPLTVVEFTDYQCPFCRRFHLSTFEQLRKKYIDTGKVRFFSRDMPLEFHADALGAAMAARCAGDQGQFWKMRDVIAANASKLSQADLLGYAQGLSLDMAPFRACLESGKYKEAIERDKAQAVSLSITGTPGFVVGKSTSYGVDGAAFVGAYPFEIFEQILKEFETAK